MFFLDLFSGIGGFALGAKWAGLSFEKHYYSEIDDYAIKVYQKRFPDAVPLGDITKIDATKLPQGDWIIAGGFPCQDISIAGKGAGLAGARSGLWYKYADLIGQLRPRYAIMENVGALTFRGLDAVLGSLAEIGYDAEWQDIRASDIGAPHKRERIWIVAYPSSQRWDATRKRKMGSEQSGKTYPPKPNSPNRADNICLFRGWYSRLFIPGHVRNNDELPIRMDRLKCLGNSIDPGIAKLIFSSEVFDDFRLTKNSHGVYSKYQQ